MIRFEYEQKKFDGLLVGWLVVGCGFDLFILTKVNDLDYEFGQSRQIGSYL